MSRTVLVTGGAGFIGSHLADELLRAGYRVRALDNLDPQVHGEGGHRPAWLAREVDLRVGDVRDPNAVRRALDDVDVVFHLAAKVGVGQSMYEMATYTSTNTYGTAVLLEALAHRPVERLVVASSMSVYGEGRYRDGDGRLHDAAERRLSDIREGRWDPVDGHGRPLVPVATPEAKTPSLASVYALSKYDQERLCMVVGATYGIPTVALRLFNVYGPRQALSNPYTGVLAIFAARLLNNRPPVVFEDGNQRRDFVSVHDVARAFRLAAEVDDAAGQVINVGSGESRTVSAIAERLAHVLGKAHLRPELTGQFRAGDIRHCFADVGLARKALGYEPAVSFEAGVGELSEWLKSAKAIDRVGEAREALAARRLTVQSVGASS